MSYIVTVDSRPMDVVLHQLYEAVQDLSPVMGSIGMEFEGRISGRFETETDPLGIPWAEWTPGTVASYPKNGNKRLLDRFGDMLGSLGHEVSNNSVTIGFGDPVAAYHEWGTEKMDRRGLIFADPDDGTLAPDDERALLDILTDYVESAAG